MTRRRALGLVALLIVLAAVAGGVWVVRRTWINRPDRQTPEALRLQIAALEAERLRLRSRLEELIVRDPRLAGMPEAPVRIAVPTALAGDLMQRILTGFTNQSTLELAGFRLKRSGSVRRVVTLGTYDLDITADRVRGGLRAGTPRLVFGGNRVAVSMPVAVTGAWRATVDFAWDGRNVSGAVCGDMHVTQPVTGTVRPLTYPLAGALEFTATTSQIHVQPKLPPIRMHLEVVPSDESWTVVQQVLAAKRGLCGFVIDRVDILGVVKRLVDKGMNVRVPTERVKAIGLPVTVEPSFEVRGAPVNLTVRVGELAITQYAIWMGAQVTLGPKPDGGRSPAP